MEGVPDENCSLAVAAELARIRDLVTQMQAQFAGQQQGRGGGDAAAGGYQLCRALLGTISSSVDRALDIVTCNRADGIAAGQCKDRKRHPKWRPIQVRVKDVAEQEGNLLDDGFSWRKYGQKEILGAKHPRGYYRCTNRTTQGCPATKQVQRTDDDPLLFDVVYHATHTCAQAPAAAAAHPNNQGRLPAAAGAEEHSPAQLLPTKEQTTASSSMLTSEVPGPVVSVKEQETPTSVYYAGPCLQEKFMVQWDGKEETQDVKLNLGYKSRPIQFSEFMQIEELPSIPGKEWDVENYSEKIKAEELDSTSCKLQALKMETQDVRFYSQGNKVEELHSTSCKEWDVENETWDVRLYPKKIEAEELDSTPCKLRDVEMETQDVGLYSQKVKVEDLHSTSCNKWDVENETRDVRLYPQKIKVEELHSTSTPCKEWDVEKATQDMRLYSQKIKADELHYTPCEDVMPCFAMGTHRQTGRPSHTCMQKAGQELLGRDDIRQKVMEKILLDSNGIKNCTVICIYGWSGLGKTSLLHVLYNDQRLLDAFDKRIWIQISGKLDILVLFRKIIEFAMNEDCSITSIHMLRELIVEEIRDKKFLLFLDDVDIENQQWTTVLEVLNTGAKGSVVVMATRSSTVPADRNVTTHSYSLNPLSEENSLRLLQHVAVGTDIQSNPDLVMITNMIISRFRSNLLYLKAIGGLLCHTDIFSIGKDKFEGSFMPLQLCHDVLPIHLKRCIALCSLFPEGYIFDKHHMVLLWISHGCVRPVEGCELEDVGVEYFNELLCRSFFQFSPIHSDKDDVFMMHELIYKVVESVSGDKYFKSEDLLRSIPENVLHCSLVSSQIQTVELMHRTEQLEDLQTFLVVQPEWKPNTISFPTLNLVGLDDFFLKFTSVETLDLSHTTTEELPGSIAGLRNLQYLSMNNTNIRGLPSQLCSLSNLQTLEAKQCRFLTELPRDIKKLVKLRHLDLTKELCYVHLPHGVGQLTQLQTFPVFHASSASSHCLISELGNLNNLRGCLWLSGLESVKTGSKAQEANLKGMQHLKDLTLQWHDDDINIEDEDQDKDAENVADEQVLESLQPHANLQVLTIRGYEGSTFPAWMQRSSSLPNLVTLTLDSCCNCTQFPAIAQLPSLKSLSVRKMYDVQRLSSNTVHGAAKFPSLELLNLWEMYGLEELFEESEGDCPRLRKVCVSRCPGLKRLPHAPSLTELVLHCCHQVPDISGLASLVSLKIEGFHGIKSLSLPAGAALKKLEIRSCKELSSVDGLSALTTVQRLKIAGCPKLVLPGTTTS